MAQHAHVPEFGNWENDGNVPYTQRFEVVRKGRNAGKVMNPNDPHENPEALRANLEAPNPKDELHASREDDLHQLTESPLPHGSATYKVPTASPLHRHGYKLNSGDHRRAGRTSGGEDSIERSPLHHHYHVKAATRGDVSSPSRGSSEGNHAYASNIAGRSRMRTGGRGDETPEKGSSVPKFGEWDENNPSSADGFTGIFEKVREEKKSGSAKATMISNDTIYVNDQDGSGGFLSCCFGWCKK